MNLSAEKKYQLILDISHKVRDTLDLDEILGHLLDTVSLVVEYDAAGIFVLNQDLVHRRNEPPQAMIAGVSRRGFDPGPAENDAMLMYGKGITGYAISACQSVVVDDVRQDARYVQGRRGTLSEITVPIIINERAIGALNLESDRIAAYTDDDVEVLQFFANFAAISIQKSMLHRQLLEQELLSKQLETARDVQSRLFPQSAPSPSGYDIAGTCLPAEEIGGDYFDYIPLARNRLGLVVADVSGHGIPAALVMTAFRALLRTKARSRLDPANTANTINRLLPEFSAGNHFVTALYAVVELASGDLNYVNCGHNPPLLLRAGGDVEKLDLKNIALGVVDDAQFRGGYMRMQNGDILALYTDGVVDLMSLGGEAFGEQRLAQVIRAHQRLPAAKIIQKVIEETQDYCGASCFQDDLTLVIVRRTQDQT